MNYLYNVNLYWVFEAKPALQLMAPTFAYSSHYPRVDHLGRKRQKIIITDGRQGDAWKSSYVPIIHRREGLGGSWGWDGLTNPNPTVSRTARLPLTPLWPLSWPLSPATICRNPSVRPVARVKVFLCTNIVGGKGAINDITFMSGCVDIPVCLPGAKNAQIYRSNQTLVNVVTIWYSGTPMPLGSCIGKYWKWGSMHLDLVAFDLGATGPWERL